MRGGFRAALSFWPRRSRAGAFVLPGGWRRRRPTDDDVAVVLAGAAQALKPVEHRSRAGQRRLDRRLGRRSRKPLLCNKQ
jgi:hypothetical protein